MNKQQVIDCNDGQKLADEVAVVCMGWEVAVDESLQIADWIDGEDGYIMRKSSWQPHLPTDIGRWQCFDLAQKCDLELDFVLNIARYDDKENELTYEVNDENMQIAILKACLLSQLGEGDE